MGSTERKPLPELEALMEELAGMAEFNRHRRLKELITALAYESADVQQLYRDAIVDAGYKKRGDFRSQLAEAKREAKTQHQDRAASAGTYAHGEDGCLYLHGDRGPLLIARFVPKVVADIVRDDGAERIRTTRIQVTLPTGYAGEVDVPAEKLRDARVWAVQAAGPGAVLMAVSRAPEHVLAAAQILGAEHERLEVFGHTGWRRFGDHWRFLTASGALGSESLDTTVTVDLGSPALNYYRFPDPAEADNRELSEAVRRSLELRMLGPLPLTVPQLGAAYRAPLPLHPDAAVWVEGLSGFGKSTFAALVQQHFGMEFRDKKLPGNFASTGNALETMAFPLANVLMVVDDYNPQTSERDQAAMKQAAERLIRGAANGAGRARMRRDGTLAPQRFPRAQILATGEDIPSGHSLLARMVITVVESELIPKIAKSGVQKLGEDGVYVLAMAAYVRWLAGIYDQRPDFQRELRSRFEEIRTDCAQAGRHRRVAEGVASLLLGWRVWLSFAEAIKAVTKSESEKIYAEAKGALLEAAGEQTRHQKTSDGAFVFGSALVAAVTQGSAHLADLQTGLCPVNPTRWGWTASGEEWRPQGRRIGWTDGKNVYLHSDAAHAVAVEHARRVGNPFGLGPTAARKRLAHAGLLASTDGRNLQVVRDLPGGARKRVLHVHWDRLGDDE